MARLPTSRPAYAGAYDAVRSIVLFIAVLSSVRNAITQSEWNTLPYFTLTHRWFRSDVVEGYGVFLRIWTPGLTFTHD